MKNKEAFLKELTELTEKHGIVIGGCGCCGSPYLLTLKERLSWEKKRKSKDSVYSVNADNNDLTYNP